MKSDSKDWALEKGDFYFHDTVTLRWKLTQKLDPMHLYLKHDYFLNFVNKMSVNSKSTFGHKWDLNLSTGLRTEHHHTGYCYSHLLYVQLLILARTKVSITKG